MSKPYFLLLNLTIIVLLFAPSGFAQSLNFGNNFFGTGDYVVGGVGLRGLGDASGFATGKIFIPDSNPGISGATSVPAGAQIVAALLYWETVESSTTAMAGQNGFFRPVYPGGPLTGYPISGVMLGNPNAPVSWSSGGCSGGSQGSKTMRTYRADVRAYLPQDANGNVVANLGDSTHYYEVRLADSGSHGGGAPLTLGATLVIIYRVMSPNFPLNSVVIYDGAFAPSNTSSPMSQTVQGFYQPTQPDSGPIIAKLTHIVGNGQSNKYEQVFFGNATPPAALNPVGTAAFPGFYNGSWDNPTWNVSPYVNPADTSETTSVQENQSNQGCVSWGAVIFSTTVQNRNQDGLLDVWKSPLPANANAPGYCDAAVNEGKCNGPGDPAWVDLPGANPNQKDVFVQLDYMCSSTDGKTCDGRYSFNPFLTVDPVTKESAVQKVIDAFSAHGINLHVVQGHAIAEQTCTDTTDALGNPVLCPYPSQQGATPQPGVVAWKGGFAFLKNEYIHADGTVCTNLPDATCSPRFQHGRKDSWHYALFAHAIGGSSWFLQDGSLASAVASGNTLIFNTPSAHGLVANDKVHGNGRVTLTDAISNPSLNGTYFVTSTSCPTNVNTNPPTLNDCSVNNTAPGPYSFTVTLTSPTTAPTLATDPNFSVGSGQAGSSSGKSDVGGADSLITLGLWGADGQTWQVQAGTFMHELGHSLALTHGGFFFDGLSQANPNNYTPTVEANCKPNHQSVMNYLFQVDLLVNPNDPTKSVVDYSEQTLDALYENKTTSSPFTTPTTYPATSWYVPWSGIGTPAKLHCDGTPILDGAQMVRMTGSTSLLSWTGPQDINFDGVIESATGSPPTSDLRGHNDWTNTAITTGIDLRQMGATGSLSTAGSGINAFGGSGVNAFGGSGVNAFGGSGVNAFGGSGVNAFGGSGVNAFGGSGVGNGEITHEAANSTTRPPSNLTATPRATAPRYVDLAWSAPTFGQIASYNVYRSDNNGPFTKIASGISAAPPLTYTDKSVHCGPTYSYVVTAVLANPVQESGPSNTAPASPLSVCAPAYAFQGFLPPLAMTDQKNTSSNSGPFLIGNPLPIMWTLQDSNGPVSNFYVNTLFAIGPIPPVYGVCPLPGPVQKVYFNPGSYTYASVQTLYSPQTGVQAKSTFTFSGGPNNQFTFSWATGPVTPGCYVIELDLDSGQVERTALKLVTPYIFTGFYSPLVAADPTNTGSYSGSFNVGKSVTAKWTLQTSNGTSVGNLNANQAIVAVGPLAVPASGTCPDNMVQPFFRYPGGYPYPYQILWSPTGGAKGNTTFRISSSNNQFILNWNTSTNQSGNCYILEVDLDTGQVERTGLKF